MKSGKTKASHLFRSCTEINCDGPFVGTLQVTVDDGTSWRFPCELTFERDSSGLLKCKALVETSDSVTELLNTWYKPFGYFPRVQFDGDCTPWLLRLEGAYFRSWGHTAKGRFAFYIEAKQVVINNQQEEPSCDRFEVGFTNLLVPFENRRIHNYERGQTSICSTDFWLGSTQLHLETVVEYFSLIKEHKDQITYFVSSIGKAEHLGTPATFVELVEVFIRQYWIATRNQVNTCWIRGYHSGNVVWERLYSPMKAHFTPNNFLIPVDRIGDGSLEKPYQYPLRTFIQGTFDKVQTLCEHHRFTKTIGFCAEAHHMAWIENSVLMQLLALDRIHEYALNSDQQAKPTLSASKQQLIGDIEIFDKSLAIRANEALMPRFPNFQQMLETLVKVYGIEQQILQITKLRRLSDLRNNFMHGKDLALKDEVDLPYYTDKLMHVLDIVMLKVVGYKGPYLNMDTKHKLQWID